MFCIAAFLLIFSCEENPDRDENIIKYDLLPLKSGREFYYSEVYFTKTAAENPDSAFGRKKWLIKDISINNADTFYTIEEFFYSRVYLNAVSFPEVPFPETDTIYLSDTTSYFEIVSKKNGEIYFSDYPTIPSNLLFQRFSSNQDTIYKLEEWITGSTAYDYYLHFVRDFGLVEIRKSYFSAIHRKGHILLLDSVL